MGKRPGQQIHDLHVTGRGDTQYNMLHISQITCVP